MTWLIAPLALLVERLVGYPQPLFRLISHPVVWIGWLIDWFERGLNRGDNRRLKGVFMLALLLGTGLAVSLLIIALTRRIPFGFLLEALLATSLLAQKSLGHAVKAVADGLMSSLDKGRAAVAGIVGRDTEALDEAGVSRAAIESLAESSSDGVIAPLFWLMLGGLPGIVLYKAINTADSMVGHRTERYNEFGWASAKLDDVVNWIPARLTVLLVVVASLLIGHRADAREALRMAMRDARKHDSPNAGWPEAAFAGALGISLGGPRAYQGETHDLPTFGDGRRDLGAVDILNSLVLYWALLNVTLGVTLAICLCLWWLRG